MKASLTAVVLLGAAVAVPAWAGEGAGDPFPFAAPPISTQMTMTRGGLDDPFKWAVNATPVTMSVKKGGIDDPFRWSSTPVQPDNTRHAATPATTRRNPG